MCAACDPDRLAWFVQAEPMGDVGRRRHLHPGAADEARILSVTVHGRARAGSSTGPGRVGSNTPGEGGPVLGAGERAGGWDAEEGGHGAWARLFGVVGFALSPCAPPPSPRTHTQTRSHGVPQAAEAPGRQRAQVRRAQGVAGPQRGQRNLHGQQPPEHPQARQGRLRHPQAPEDPLARPRPPRPRGQAQGPSLRLRQAPRDPRGPAPHQGFVAAAHARVEASVAQVPRCQEDRQAHVPRHVHEGEGKRVQEQACVDGEHSQVEGREGAREDSVGPVRGEACEEQGDARAQDCEEGGASGSGHP